MSQIFHTQVVIEATRMTVKIIGKRKVNNAGKLKLPQWSNTLIDPQGLFGKKRTNLQLNLILFQRMS